MEGLEKRIEALEKKMGVMDPEELRKKVFGVLSTPVTKKQNVNDLWQEVLDLPVGQAIKDWGNCKGITRISDDEWQMFDEDINGGYQSIGPNPDLRVLAVYYVKLRRYLEGKCGRLWHDVYNREYVSGFHSTTGLEIVLFECGYCELKYYKDDRFLEIKKKWKK